MKDSILIELASKWDRDANPSYPEDGSPSAALSNAVEQGRRAGLRECAMSLRTVVKILGGNEEIVDD